MTAPGAGPGPPLPLRLGAEAAASIREEIRRAKGREVSFLAEVGPGRVLVNPRAVARGNRSAVLAVSRDAPQGSVLLHNHPSGDLAPSGADLAVAAAAFEEGIGSAIVDNDASQIYVVVEPPEPRVVVPLEEEEVKALLGPGGALAAALPSFEDRPGQREMAALVSRTYNEGGVSLVEAGTGTGKSMGYLLPAALWALRNEDRSVISTNTINLQEQLIGKDLPLLEEVLGEELPWALVKGRGNYISIRRALLAAATAPALFPEDRSREIHALLGWMETTADGSLSDLAAPPSEEVWEEVQSDPDICLRARCPHFQRCFFQKARREASGAKLLVVNHHLLFADLAVRRATNNFTQASVLPPYRHLVLDEAHNAESAATDHLGVEITGRGLFRLLSRLENRGRGVLTDLESRFSSDPEVGSATDFLVRVRERIRPGLEEARKTLEPLLASLDQALPEGVNDTVRLGGREGIEPGQNVAVGEALASFLLSFRSLAKEVGELRARLGADEAWAETLEGRMLDLQSIQNRLAAAAKGVQRVLNPGDEAPGLVRWFERKRATIRGKRNLGLAAAPIEVGPILRDDLFGRLESTTLTSATLTTRTGFEYVRSRLGLSQEAVEGFRSGWTVQEAVVPSPFDFQRQSLLAVPTDLSGPLHSGDEFQGDTARVVIEMAGLIGGGLFVLFTSHRALGRVAELLRAEEVSLPGPLLVQGDRPRGRLLTEFTDAGNGILLGTASFWEGVDVPGDPLRGLIIQKLPFQVPTEPIVAARMESIEAQGGDPFWRYTLPEAALRLKQGFGRLIRTQEDRGAVLILDDRILSRRYGPYLRQSLPPAPLAKGPWDELRRILERLYREW